MEKTVDYYMSLPYAVELKCYEDTFRASIKELPECTAAVPAFDRVDKLWRLLEKNLREWIERELEMGREVLEPPGVTRDPFWEDFEEGNPHYDEDQVRSTLYEYGVTCFPLRILEDLWLRELEAVRLGEVKPSTSVPPKAEINHGNQSANTHGTLLATMCASPPCTVTLMELGRGHPKAISSVSVTLLPAMARASNGSGCTGPWS